MSFSQTEPRDETPPEPVDPLDTVTRERDYLKRRCEQQVFELIYLRNVLRAIDLGHPHPRALAYAATFIAPEAVESREAADAAFEKAGA